MLDYMIDFLISGFIFPGISWNQLLLGIGLGLVFGAVWFAGYWTPVLKRPWAWGILACGAFLSWVAVAFVQIPLQLWTGKAINHFWSQEVVMNWVLIAGIPQVLLSGLVQEGAKMVPMVVYWWKNDRYISPKTGLIVGAVAGLGLGVFEAVWAHNLILGTGFTWELVESGGLIMLAGFWERFFTLPIHIGVSALAGYGLAKRKGWQFYLLAAFLHSLANYSVVFIQKGILTTVHVEIYVAVFAVIVTGFVLWLRWSRVNKDTNDYYEEDAV